MFPQERFLATRPIDSLTKSQAEIVIRDMSELQAAMSDKEDEKPTDTSESSEDEDDYPEAFDLAMIIVALVLSMFLVRWK